MTTYVKKAVVSPFAPSVMYEFLPFYTAKEMRNVKEYLARRNLQRPVCLFASSAMFSLV